MDKKERVSQEVQIEEKETKSSEEIEKLKTELDKKTKEAQEYHEKWLRTMAELDNLRKRTEKQLSEYLKFANEQLLKELLPIMDNLERALGHAHSSNNMKGILEGIELTLKMLQQCLEKFGVKPVKTVGEKFDPYVHEAVKIEERREGGDIVVEEHQKGYLLHDRLLRPALVTVTKTKTQ